MERIRKRGKRVGRERSEEKTGRQAGRWFKQFNRFVNLWQTECLIFVGCRTFVCLLCLKRNFILRLTTKAAFDKMLGRIRRVLFIFPFALFLG